MKLHNSQVSRLKEMISLEEKRVALLGELDAVQQQLAALHGSVLESRVTINIPEVKTSASTKREVKSSARARTEKKPAGTRRGALSEKILAALTAAGKEGSTFQDLAQETGSHYRNIAIWFSTTGKKNPAIKKVAPARFRLVS